MNTAQKLLLNFLYELRNTPMIPPDPRISYTGIGQALGTQISNLPVELAVLKEKGFVLPFQIEGKTNYKITLAGISEVEKCMVTTIEGEVSTSKIGIKARKNRLESRRGDYG